MTDKELLRVCAQFRKGLLSGGSSKSKCFIMTMPLIGYLSMLGVWCIQMEVEIEQGDDELHRHFCIQLKDGRIIDPTADQFVDPDGKKMPPVYLGEKPEWYLKTNRK